MTSGRTAGTGGTYPLWNARVGTPRREDSPDGRESAYVEVRENLVSAAKETRETRSVELRETPLPLGWRSPMPVPVRICVICPGLGLEL